MQELERKDERKLKRVRKAIGLLSEDPRYPSLNAHKFESQKGPNGVDIWESYVETILQALGGFFGFMDLMGARSRFSQSRRTLKKHEKCNWSTIKMISLGLEQEILLQLEKLPLRQQRRVLDFARELSSTQIKGVSGSVLIPFAGTIEADDLRIMSHAANEDCEKKTVVL